MPLFAGPLSYAHAYGLSMSRPAKLALADGTVFDGHGFGASGEVFGEVVFNTSMTGYQEILTDPSYAGQIVTMTYPLIGNYGINPEDVESGGLSLRGFIVRENCRHESNYRSIKSLHDYLAEHGIVGLEGIDTRALVRILRTSGALRGVICLDDTISDAQIVEMAKNSPEMSGRNLAEAASCPDATPWAETLGQWRPMARSG
ncbi:MAG: carbamoyl-phosphate synthase domain-containing protein, partial [Planctomycetaceae bacterium]